MSIAKEVLIEELEEQIHPENVEDVIFWALEFYVKNKKEETMGKLVASYLVKKIEDTENKTRAKFN